MKAQEFYNHVSDLATGVLRRTSFARRAGWLLNQSLRPSSFVEQSAILKVVEPRTSVVGETLGNVQRNMEKSGEGGFASQGCSCLSSAPACSLSTCPHEASEALLLDGGRVDTRFDRPVTSLMGASLLRHA